MAAGAGVVVTTVVIVANQSMFANIRKVFYRWTYTTLRSVGQYGMAGQPGR